LGCQRRGLLPPLPGEISWSTRVFEQLARQRWCGPPSCPAVGRKPGGDGAPPGSTTPPVRGRGRARGLRADVSLFRCQCLASRGDVHVTCRFRARKGVTASFRATFPSSKLAMCSRRDAALKAPYKPVCQLTSWAGSDNAARFVGTFRAGRVNPPWRARFDNFLATSRSPFFTSCARGGPGAKLRCCAPRGAGSRWCRWGGVAGDAVGVWACPGSPSGAGGPSVGVSHSHLSTNGRAAPVRSGPVRPCTSRSRLTTD